MDRRPLENSLAWLTIALLIIYAPIETWISWSGGLTHPMYLVDVVGMALMLFGAVVSLRARPGSAVGGLVAAWAWNGANGWRATAWRYLELRDGGALEHGRAELLMTGVGAVISWVCLALALDLALRRPRQNGLR